MAAPAISVPVDRARAASPAWVIGRSADLTWLIGGVLVAYALLASHLFLGVAAVTIYMLWVLAVDGPHVFATLTRTYLDPAERAARSRLLAWSLCFFALGPAAVVVSGVWAIAPRTTPFFCSVCSGPTGTWCGSTTA